MADWISVALLILVGIVLIIVEIVFVPGTTVVGLLGFGMLIGGVYMSFVNFGRTPGMWVLAGASMVSILALIYSLRGGTWQKFALKSSIDSKVNEGETTTLQIGMKGKAISDLRPMGTAEFEDRFYEVQTNGSYLDAGTMVEIIRLTDNKIIVKPIK